MDAPPAPTSADQAFLNMLVAPDALNLILVRHGQAGGNGKLEGYIGPALSTLGEQQADLVAQRLANYPIDGVYASDVARSHQTAWAVAQQHREAPFRNVPDLREISSFQIRGKPPARKRLEREALAEERQRVARFADHLGANYKPGQLIAIVAHNGVNGMLLAQLVGLSYRQSVFYHCCHTSVTIANVSLEDHTVSIRLMGCTRHLPPEMVSHENVWTIAARDAATESEAERHHDGYAP